MKISTDGGKTFLEVETAEVVYEGIEVPGEDAEGELHVKFTHEGIISDVWVSRDSPLDYNIATRSQMVDELVHEMVVEDE